VVFGGALAQRTTSRCRSRRNTATPHVHRSDHPEELVSAFCGHDDGAHPPFAAMSPPPSRLARRRTAGRGSLQGVVLDIEPSRESEDNRALAVKEGERFAAFLGVSISADGTGPLRIPEVEPEAAPPRLAWRRGRPRRAFRRPAQRHLRLRSASRRPHGTHRLASRQRQRRRV
jgi:hypothetical protein